MVEDVHALLCHLDFLLVGEQAKGQLPQKNGKMWEFFPSGGPPSPLFGNDMFFLKKNYGLFCILGPFFGGSPM